MIDLTSACVAHYKMNDAAASKTVVDSQGYSNGDAQQNTEDLTTTGKVNDALTFNGTSDYLNANNIFQSVFQSDFSISLWFKTNDGQPSGYGRDLFGALADDGKNLVNCVHRSTGVIQFGYAADSFDPDNAITPVILNDGQEDWHHLVCIAEQTAPTEVTISIYFDSEFQDSEVLTAITMSNFSSSRLLFIGQANADGNPIAGFYFDGLIDNLPIFSKGLSQAEIDFLYNNGAGTEHLDSGAMPAGMLTEMWSF